MNYFYIEKTKLDKEVYTIGYESAMLYHSHEYFELYFLYEGKKSYCAEGRIYEFEKNTLVVVPPNLLHKYENAPYERVVIYIPKEFISPNQVEFLYKLSTQEVFRFEDEAFNQIKSVVNEMLKSYESKMSDNVHIGLSLGYLFFLIDKYKYPIDIYGHADHDISVVHPVVLKLLGYIKENYKTQIKMSELCDMFCLSKVTLCALFKKMMGMTIIDYQTKLRLEDACYQLSNQGYSVDTVAKNCGFGSGKYFGSVFKKKIGVTPMQFRKQSLNPKKHIYNVNSHKKAAEA